MTPPPAVPEFLSRLASEYIVNDGKHRLIPHIQSISEKKPAQDLATFLQSQARQQPVIIFAPFVISSEQKGSMREQQLFSTYVIPMARILAEHLAGLAHVVLLANGQDVVLEQELGGEYAIRAGEIRLYPPFEKPDRPYSMWAATSNMRGDTVREKWAGFEKTIIRRIIGTTYQKTRGQIPTGSIFLIAQAKLAPPVDIEAAKAIAAEQSLNALIEVSERFDEIESAKSLGAALDNIGTAQMLKRDIETLRRLQAIEPTGELNEIFIETIQQGAKLRAGFMATAYGITKPYEEKYETMTAWIEEHYSDRLVLSEKTKSVLKDPKRAKYHDVNMIYAAVELLATHYRDMKTGNGRGAEFHRARFEDRLKKLRLEDTPSLTVTSRTRFAEEYRVTVEGETFELDRHIKRGNSPDPTESVRIYYGWDEKRKRIVIGSLAGHKRNALTT
jgi:hypothetical protein